MPHLPVKLHWPGTWFHAVRHIEDGQPETVEISVVQRGHRESITLDARTLDVLLKYSSEIRYVLMMVGKTGGYDCVAEDAADQGEFVNDPSKQPSNAHELGDGMARYLAARARVT